MVVAARSLEAAAEVADEIGGVALVLDVADPASIADAAASLDALDVLVNNAAAYPDWQETPLTADLDGLDVAWRTNVLGPWRLAQALAPLLAAAGNPRIVNVTSGSGSHGDPQFGLGAGPGMAPYAVTKAAANALTRKLAAELPGIRVNAVDPGLTATAPGGGHGRAAGAGGRRGRGLGGDARPGRPDRRLLPRRASAPLVSGDRRNDQMRSIRRSEPRIRGQSVVGVVGGRLSPAAG